MFPLSAIHAIAAARGDGLRPEFLAMMRRIEAESAVADIGRRRGDVLVQAGPNPTGAIGAVMPEGVIRFPSLDRKTITKAGALPAKRNI